MFAATPTRRRDGMLSLFDGTGIYKRVERPEFETRTSVSSQCADQTRTFSCSKPFGVGRIGSQRQNDASRSIFLISVSNKSRLQT